MPLFGMNSALIPIIGYNYGARNKERIKKAYKIGCIYGCAFMWTGFAIFQLLPEQLLSFFSASENMMEIGVYALRVISMVFIFAGISVITGSLFQATGKSMYSMLVSFIRQLIVLLPAAYLLSKLGNVNYVWFSLPLAELVGFATTLILMRILLKKLDGMMQQLQ
jgi:Na+-driven multidrug efflux pump